MQRKAAPSKILKCKEHVEKWPLLPENKWNFRRWNLVNHFLDQKNVPSYNRKWYKLNFFRVANTKFVILFCIVYFLYRKFMDRSLSTDFFPSSSFSVLEFSLSSEAKRITTVKPFFPSQFSNCFDAKRKKQFFTITWTFFLYFSGWHHRVGGAWCLLHGLWDTTEEPKE